MPLYFVFVFKMLPSYSLNYHQTLNTTKWLATNISNKCNRKTDRHKFVCWVPALLWTKNTLTHFGSPRDFCNRAVYPPFHLCLWLCNNLCHVQRSRSLFNIHSVSSQKDKGSLQEYSQYFANTNPLHIQVSFWESVWFATTIKLTFQVRTPKFNQPVLTI